MVQKVCIHVGVLADVQGLAILNDSFQSTQPASSRSRISKTHISGSEGRSSSQIDPP
jgi:hypothetical protein